MCCGSDLHRRGVLWRWNLRDGSHELRRSLRRHAHRHAQLRHLRACMLHGTNLCLGQLHHRWRVHDGLRHVWWHLHRYAARRHALWCVLHAVSFGADVHVGPLWYGRRMHHGGLHDVQRCVYRYATRPEPLRRLWACVQRRAGVQRGCVRCTNGMHDRADDVLRCVCRYTLRSRQLWALWHAVHEWTDLQRGRVWHMPCGADTLHQCHGGHVLREHTDRPRQLWRLQSHVSARNLDALRERRVPLSGTDLDQRTTRCALRPSLCALRLSRLALAV